MSEFSILFIVKKLPYYISSAIVLLLNLKNPWALLGYVLKRNVILKLRNGLVIETSQAMDALMIKETIFDDAYGLKTLKNPKYILDAGGAIGDFSLFAHHLYPQAEIHVFEPNPRSFPLLQKNIETNNAKNIHAHNIALGKKTSYDFYIATHNVRSSFIKDSYSDEKITVQAEPLSSYTEQPVDMLKIDTEGGEIDILESASQKDLEKCKRVVCEYHNHLVEDQDEKIMDILRHVLKVTKLEDPYNPDIGYIIGQQ